MAVSQNGYKYGDISLTDSYLIPGTKVRLRLRKGTVAVCLLNAASLIDDYVEDIDQIRTFETDIKPTRNGGGASKVFDDWSWAVRLIRGSVSSLSNHGSGTAFDFNATQHPRTVKNTFEAWQIREMRKILNLFDDPATGKCVLRWGEDYSTTVDGMHIEINASLTAVRRVAKVLPGRVRAYKISKGAPDMPLDNKDLAAIFAYKAIVNKTPKVGDIELKRSLADAISDIENTQEDTHHASTGRINDITNRVVRIEQQNAAIINGLLEIRSLLASPGESPDQPLPPL